MSITCVILLLHFSDVRSVFDVIQQCENGGRTYYCRFDISTYYLGMNCSENSLNRGVSHYRILPVSRDFGWPVQQLDYFRYIKQHILTLELLYIGYNFKEIKKRHLLIEESDKTACHYGHLWLHLYTVFILCWPKLRPVLSSMSARGAL